MFFFMTAILLWLFFLWSAINPGQNRSGICFCFLIFFRKHHESKSVLKLLVIRSADRNLCIIRKYNAFMTVSTYSMKINGKAVMTEAEIRFHSFGKSCQSFFCCIGSCSGIDRGLPQISFQIKNIGAEHLIIA